MLTELIESVERARDDVISSVKELRPDQATFKPSPDTWSIVENIEHLYLAEISGVTKIWAAADQVRAGSHWTDARPNHGQSIEAVVEQTWKSKEIAPSIATPHIGGPLSAWVSCLKSLRPVLSDLAKELEALDLEAIVYPHYLSGPLDGRQRLEFLRYHMERHLAQIQRVQSHPQFPR
ncbi:MAG TPA: DinB family protein [Gemmatimonadaceae bacterium]|nr:DinB family protein [Gemmatimonadaceae bacterium]